MKESARVYDFKTKKITTIPNKELAPGMIEANVIGVGLVWIDSKDCTSSDEFRHQSFSADVRSQIEGIKSALDEVHPKPLQNWEDGFRRDSNPEIEIKVWERIAAVYQRCIQDESLTPKQRMDYFNVISTCSISSRNAVLEVFKPTAITRIQAMDAISLYFDGE